MISERRSGWMHRKAEEEGALVLGVDRRQRSEAPPGRREPDQPICAASKQEIEGVTVPRAYCSKVAVIDGCDPGDIREASRNDYSDISPAASV
jgi:hypothetical protein